jgi:hypothetical protein
LLCPFAGSALPTVANGWSSQEPNRKKAKYYEGFESGKLDLSLVGERLQQLKDDEEKLAMQVA